MRSRVLAWLVVALLAGTCAASAHGGALAAARRVAELAYVTGNGSNDSVWIRPLGRGRPRRIAAGDQPLLAPSGGSVAFSRLAPSGPALLVAPATGGRAETFFDAAGQSADALAWSPDSRWLAVDVLGSSAGLDVIDTRTGSVTQIAAGTVCGAGFAPDRSGRLVFSLSAGDCLTGPDDLYTATAGQSAPTPLSSDGRSLFPVWGRRGIAYDQLTPRGRAAPELQIWLLPPSGPAAPLTDVAVSSLQDGPVPVAFSADGQHLLARLVGQDAVQAWTVSVAGDRVRRLSLRGHTLSPDAVSADGRSVLLDADSFERAPSNGSVISLPFGGGRATALAAGAAGGSWNR